MGDHHDGGFGEEGPELREDARGRIFVERGGHLVEQQQVGARQNRTDEEHALLLAARKDVRPLGRFVDPVGKMPELHVGEKLHARLVRETLGRRRVGEVLAERALEEIGLLRDPEDRFAAALPENAGEVLIEPGDRLEEGAFARARFARDEDEPPATGGEREGRAPRRQAAPFALFVRKGEDEAGLGRLARCGLSGRQRLGCPLVKAPRICMRPPS